MNFLYTNLNKFFKAAGLLLAASALIFILSGTHTAQAASYNATNLLGHNDANGNPLWNSLAPNGTNAVGLFSPQGIALDTVNHRMFVADNLNNRVLVYNLSNSNAFSTSTASYVLGQTNFINAAAATTQSGLNGPVGLAYDSANQRLFVADNLGKRVVVFDVNTATITNGENASYVLGQTNFTNKINGPTQSVITGSSYLAYDSVNMRLFVADGGSNGNNRILAFNVATSTISNGEAASFVLGQSGFTSSTATSTQSGLSQPAGLAYNSIDNLLYVADNLNNRVLVFSTPANATSSINGSLALNVLGQSSFTASTSAVTQTGMIKPNGLVFDAANNRLFVANGFGGNRVLAFDVATSTISNGEPATFVLGQPNFTSSGAAVGAATMNLPQGIDYDPINQNLFVVDNTNNRVTIFNTPSGATSSINGESALDEWGQYDSSGNRQLTWNNPNNGPTNQGLYFIPIGAGLAGGHVAVDPINHRLFVGDGYNLRILVFNLDSNNNISTTTASYVLGQNDFNTNTSTPFSQNHFGASGTTPAVFGLAYDQVNQRLFATFGANSGKRTLAFNVATSTISNGENATFVLGESNFTNTSGGNGQSTMNGQGQTVYDSVNQRLFVADTSNNRVLAFSTPSNATSSINGSAALFVLGQSTFTAVTASTSQTGLSGPYGLAYDSANNRLFVGDTVNNRVMVFSVPGNATSSINGEAASFVLGQSGFTTATGATTQTGLKSPSYLAYDPTTSRLFVNDETNAVTGNNRIVIFNI